MAKHSNRHSRSRRHSRRRRSISRRYKGGSGNYSSATTYGSYVNGSADSQFNRVFDQGGADAGRQSNVIIGAQGQWAQSPHSPTSNNLSLVQSAGKRNNKRKSRRGGFFAEVINQAVVPVALLTMQQKYGRNKKGNKTHRRY